MKERAERVRAFFDHPQRYLAGNRAIPLRRRLVAELAGEVDGERVLDLGCGDGSLSRQFIGHASGTTLVDASTRMLDLARDAVPPGCSERVRYVNADLLDVPEEQYDLVLCVGVLAHVGSVTAALAKIARLTATSGRCVIQLTDQGHPVGRLVAACHSVRFARRGYTLNRLSLASIVALAARQGLEVAAVRRYPFIPRRLRTRWLAEVERQMVDGQRLQWLGSEVMVSFVKGTRAEMP